MSDKTKSKRQPRPDPSTQPASAPYEPAGRAWRGIDMGGSDETLEGVEGGQAPESDEGAAAYAAQENQAPQPAAPAATEAQQAAPSAGDERAA